MTSEINKNDMSLHKILSFIIIGLFATLVISCEKRTIRTYLHNDTDCGVTVNYGFVSWKSAPRSVYLSAGQELEIPEVDYWEVTQHSTDDSVVFLFDDGLREVHFYKIEIDPLGFGHDTFIPETNNILSNSLDPHPSWTEKNTSGNKWRYDYHIIR